MQHQDDPGRRLARWWTPCFVIVWLTTMATFACAYFFGFAYAKPMAVIAGSMIVVLVVAGIALARHSSNVRPIADDEWRPTFNPASGLPMVRGSRVDIGGNLYGQKPLPPPEFRANDD